MASFRFVSSNCTCFLSSSMDVPSLVMIVLDSFMKSSRSFEARRAETAASAGGSFWLAAADDEPMTLPLLPLPPLLKADMLRRLRLAGALADDSLLLLLDSSFTELNLSSCRQLSGESLSLLPELVPQLTALDLSWCCQLRDLDLANFALPSLQAIALRGCFRLSTDLVWGLVGRCPALTTINLASCDGVLALPARERDPTRERDPAGGSNASPTRTTAPLAPALPHQLRSLLVRSSSISNWCALPTVCPHLHTLVLRGAASLDDSDVNRLLGGCPELRHLDLRGIPQLRGSFLLCCGSASLVSLLLSSAALGATRSSDEATGVVTAVAAEAAQAAAQAAGLALGRLADSAPALVASLVAGPLRSLGGLMHGAGRGSQGGRLPLRATSAEEVGSLRAAGQMG